MNNASFPFRPSIWQTWVLSTWTLFFISFICFSLEASTLSLGEVDFKWHKKAITVCWLDDSIPLATNFAREHYDSIQSLQKNFITIERSQKQQIQLLIQKEFTPSRTGIHFVGWRSCKSTKDYDVVIMTGYLPSEDGEPPLRGRASIGRRLTSEAVRIDPKHKGYVYLNTADSKSTPKVSTFDAVLNVSLHEFGHITGLRHEHIRPDGCEQDSIEDLKSAKQLSQYDPYSIMNYCFLDLIEVSPGKTFYLDKLHVIRPDQTYKGLPIFEFGIFQNYMKNQPLDRTIITESVVNFTISKYDIRLGLSFLDLKGLKEMYSF